MPIKRARSQRRFVRFDARILKDKYLDHRAKLILIYLLSKTDDWNLSVQDVAHNLEMNTKTASKYVKQLIKNGYILRARIRDKKNNFYWVSTIFEDPRDNKLGEL